MPVSAAAAVAVGPSYRSSRFDLEVMLTERANEGKKNWLIDCKSSDFRLDEISRKLLRKY